MNRRMAFATENITLKDICAAYSVSKNINALRGKLYYTASGTEVTIPSSGEVDIGQFKGKYKSVLNGTLSNKTANGENVDRYTSWIGITITNDAVYGSVGFNTASYVIAGNTLISLTVNFVQGSSTGGASSSSGNNSPNVYIVADGTTISSAMGGQTFTLSATSTLDIHAWSQASTNLGRQSSQGGSWKYKISSSGLTYDTFVSGY